MRDEAKEFFVRDIKIARSGDREVIGVPNNRTNIRVGDVFVTRYNEQISIEGFSADQEQPVAIGQIEVCLTVSQIEWPMGRVAEELPQGHTGALRLVGTGLENVTRNCFLRT